MSPGREDGGVGEGRGDRCLLCGGATAALVGEVRSESSRYGFAECRQCRSQLAVPMRSDRGDYDAIYGERKRSGYSKYHGYRRAVGHFGRGADWLAKREPAYGLVVDWLRSSGVGTGGKIVEVGAGLGYLTAALRREGFAAYGADLSERAVAAARGTFGNFYCTVDQAITEHGASADVVVACETVEHVADPVEFVRTLGAMCREGGHIVLTSPNRDAYPASAVWQTDPPPVHLWWFTEAGLLALARTAGWSARMLPQRRSGRQAMVRIDAGDHARYERPRASLYPESRSAAARAVAYRCLNTLGVLSVVQGMADAGRGDVDRRWSTLGAVLERP